MCKHTFVEVIFIFLALRPAAGCGVELVADTAKESTTTFFIALALLGLVSLLGTSTELIAEATEESSAALAFLATSLFVTSLIVAAGVVVACLVITSLSAVNLMRALTLAAAISGPIATTTECFVEVIHVKLERII